MCIVTVQLFYVLIQSDTTTYTAPILMILTIIVRTLDGLINNVVQCTYLVLIPFYVNIQGINIIYQFKAEAPLPIADNSLAYFFKHPGFLCISDNPSSSLITCYIAINVVMRIVVLIVF